MAACFVAYRMGAADRDKRGKGQKVSACTHEADFHQHAPAEFSHRLSNTLPHFCKSLLKNVDKDAKFETLRRNCDTAAYPVAEIHKEIKEQK